jgi:hypothetical protein
LIETIEKTSQRSVLTTSTTQRALVVFQGVDETLDGLRGRPNISGHLSTEVTGIAAEIQEEVLISHSGPVSFEDPSKVVAEHFVFLVVRLAERPSIFTPCHHGLEVLFQSLCVIPQVFVWYFFFGIILEPTEDGQSVSNCLLERPRQI